MTEFLNSRHARVIAAALAIAFLFLLFFSDYVVQFVLSYLYVYKYSTLFFVIFLAGLGLPIPINILITAVGALSIEGTFSFTTSLLVCSLGNLTGDMISFLFFRNYGRRILRDKFAEKYAFFNRLEEFFIDHTALSIYISRIIGLFGTPVNFLAGYLKISTFRFLIHNFIGNSIFIFIFLELGYLVGDKWVTVSDFVSTAMSLVSAILLFSLIMFIYKSQKASTTTV